ncbi:MAG: NAD-dependent epimerase/dehydratase family protein [Bacteroidaceae bacterium]|nr:NAD-dependent epimerase/dehydratase family protein [Bacteroidaceae bacterium]
MKILLTGAAGFIGNALALRLLAEGHEVVALDSVNDYYTPTLKLARLELLGLKAEMPEYGTMLGGNEGFRFVRLDLSDREGMEQLFRREHFDRVIHLAAQAGVRYSLQNPHAYIDSNIVGFLNVLEGCRHGGVSRLVYASSSSVYGGNEHVPFSEDDRVDSPVSLYAATKKSNELMAHVYAHLYGLKTTGLRFFTVYGPWGRPDMAPWLFADAILHDRTLRLFNGGDMMRDFTFIDDIVEGTLRIALAAESPRPVYNIGCGSPQPLMLFLQTLETALSHKAQIEKAPMQPGDVHRTWADTTALQQDFGYSPTIGLREGVERFAHWFKQAYTRFV